MGGVCGVINIGKGFFIFKFICLIKSNLFYFQTSVNYVSSTPYIQIEPICLCNPSTPKGSRVGVSLFGFDQFVTSLSVRVLTSAMRLWTLQWGLNRDV